MSASSQPRALEAAGGKVAGMGAVVAGGLREPEGSLEDTSLGGLARVSAARPCGVRLPSISGPEAW